MKTPDNLRFAVHDRSDGVDVGPKQLLHVTAEEESPRKGQLRNLKLGASEAHHPAYDENEFQQLVRKGTVAWADTPDASEWVESLRGGNP